MQEHADIARALFHHHDSDAVVFVTTRTDNGQPNITMVEWITFASDNPVMFVLSIEDGSYMYEIIQQTGQFVIAIPHKDMSWGTPEELAGIALQDPEKTNAPLIADAIANFECELVEITKPGNRALVVGKVIAAHINTNTGLQRLFNTAKGYKLTGLRTAGKEPLHSSKSDN